MGNFVRLINITFILSTLVLISACGGGGTGDVATESPPAATPPAIVNEYSVSGTVSGLVASNLVIQSNLADEITIDADGSFVFPTDFENGTNYEVVITLQPQTQTCTLNNASGQVSNQNVTDVAINCVGNTPPPPPPVESEYNISGSVAGLIASQVVIQSNLGDEIIIETDGGFVFPTAFENGTNYQVLIAIQPEAQTCSISNANGQVADEDVTNVSIICENNAPAPAPPPPPPTPPPSASYSVSGSVTGLVTSQLVIQSNLAEEITIDVDGSFVFTTDFPSGSDYEVIVALQPQTLTCSVSNAAGQVLNDNVTNVAINCEETAYDIVYVRYPNESDEDQFINIPQGEHAYDIAAGADLMLLKSDGSEVLLVDCEQCSVMDPFISFDGKTVYYSLIEEPTIESASWIYKINLSEGNYEPIRLTFNDGFDSSLYSNNNTPEHDQGSVRGIRDMAPAPLADGRIVFTSNRSALTAFRAHTNAIVKGSVQQLYVIDDHDGTASTKELSNLRLLETGNLHLVQHPFQLKDGRIMFSTWQDAGTKFSYAMTTLFTIYPDGTNLMQFTEPHDHHKNVDHFATQLAEGSIVSGYYYPSFDYGFGLLMKYPIESEGPDFLRGSSDATYTHSQQGRISFREFDRKGTESITPHTTGKDIPAPNLSGKYSMPSATVRDGLLVAYSSGSVNHFNAACNGAVNLCEPLRSGIYLIEDAPNARVTDPASLIAIKDDPNYNEIWPRVVASYYDIHGQEKPDIIEYDALDNRLNIGEAAGLVGSSSMLNREPLNEGAPDPFKPSIKRELNDGNWKIEGAEAGVVTDADIYGVRIVVSPPIPFTKPIRKGRNRGDWDSIERHLADTRLDDVVARYGSLHSERWEILGEFPLTHTDVIDAQGNPDTSWVAKVPADTPFFIQTLDANGMTVISELTWRGVKSGETRTDCGGCHAHSIEPLDFATTQAGLGTPISNVANLDLSDPIIQEGLWDLTQGEIPLFADTGIEKQTGYSYGVEFTRDILPVINANCVSCHTANTNALVLDGSDNLVDAYSAITDNSEKIYKSPQVSKYLRVPQARQSLLTWIVWGERLDGRQNSDRDDDVDYPSNHPTMSLTDLEKRTVARWIDLGAPIDFPELNMSGQGGFRYTDDYQLPVINIHQPKRGENTENEAIIGFSDAKSGLNWSSLAISFYPVDESENAQSISQFNRSNRDVITFNLPSMVTSKNYILKVEILDMAGNKNVQTTKFSWGG
ncbi:hypothetical protein GPAL_2929 [Glaciecola pallidula DSM 14239 = ACAM 615]|uniref:Hydrazine synthase alpha subunit middle domain-containing protein n=1 Tax=Brumicola pallidula DSM 14239 = ACAM 615 TaxID=1121922 RepID=K7A2S1_9ALTE|nr:hypothetical protein GPAL_2929 [Glaciecola pallidula DSM 14239 = ACAM 615]